ncbi:MAG: AAA family ATPase, partial [Candidatus Delongbacteria bacterium]|nr:AAA family ATPase [Candidatus Delongbacteria bacterium]
VDKFLAIPMYINLLGYKPERIDTNLFYEKYENILKSYHESVYGWLSSRASERQISVIKFFENLTLDDAKSVFKYNNQGKALLTEKNKSRFFKTIKTIKDRDIEKELRFSGFLTYRHCYGLALKCIHDYPNIIDVFRKRFKYVFIDEAQDTDDIQFRIIQELFEECQVVIQKIGDNNQAIFNFTGQKAKGWKIKEDNIEIKNTKRLSIPIAEQVLKIACLPQVLCGNDSIEIKPIIFLFEDNQIEQVIRRFTNLIVEHDLHLVQNSIFKIVGGVGKKNENGHTLPSYYPDYKKDENNSLDFDNLTEKLNQFDNTNIKPKDYRNIILGVVKEYLKRKKMKNGEKYFTNSTLLKHLKENNENSYNVFKLGLLEITTKLILKQCVKVQMENLVTIVDIDFDSLILESVIKNYKLEFDSKENNKSNILKNENPQFKIEISTIHKVKGETHTATLVLETFNRAYDLFQLLELLKGKNKSGLEAKKKLIYVAMSRATHLLCLAIHKSQKKSTITSDDIEILEANGFRIIEL